MALPLQVCLGRGRVHGLCSPTTWASRAVSLHSQVALPGDSVHKDKGNPPSFQIQALLDFRVGREFSLSLTLHHRLPGTCVSWCISDHLPIM